MVNHHLPHNSWPQSPGIKKKNGKKRCSNTSIWAKYANIMCLKWLQHVQIHTGAPIHPENSSFCSTKPSIWVNMLSHPINGPWLPWLFVCHNQRVPFSWKKWRLRVILIHTHPHPIILRFLFTMAMFLWLDDLEKPDTKALYLAEWRPRPLQQRSSSPFGSW